jgi:hypothetical protein
MSSQNEGVPPPAATGARAARVTLPVKNPYTGEARDRHPTRPMHRFYLSRPRSVSPVLAAAMIVCI